jgi:RNA binding exosome subunit
MLEFSLAEVDIIIHATEDQDKLLNIIKDKLKLDKFTINILEGYYGNEIRLANTKLDSKKALDLASFIFNSLNIYDKNKLINNLALYIDKNSLYVRISKQGIFNNKIVLSDEDPIRLKFKFKNIKDNLEYNIKELLRWLEERDAIY